MASRSKKIQAQLAKKNFMLRGMRKPVSRLDKGTPFVGLLDQVPGAAAAWSERVLAAAFQNQWLWHERRDSDNDEVLVLPDATGWRGNNSTLLDPVTLNPVGTTYADWFGSASAHRVDWRDQSGNGNNAGQTSASSQPLSVEAGSIVMENGRPALFFDGVSSYLDTPLPFSSDYYAFLLFSDLGSDNFQIVIGSTNTVRRILILKRNDFWYQFYAGDFQIKSNTISGTSGNRFLFYIEKNQTTDKKMFINGVDETSLVDTTADSGGGNIQIGTEDNGSALWTGNYQEMIFYNTQKRTERPAIVEPNINNAFNITP